MTRRAFFALALLPWLPKPALPARGSSGGLDPLIAQWRAPASLDEQARVVRSICDWVRYGGRTGNWSRVFRVLYGERA